MKRRSTSFSGYSVKDYLSSSAPATPSHSETKRDSDDGNDWATSSPTSRPHDKRLNALSSGRSISTRDINDKSYLTPQKRERVTSIKGTPLTKAEIANIWNKEA